MKVTGATIQQLDKFRPDGRPLPRSECRRWRLWATTGEGRKSKRFRGTYTQAQERLRAFVAELEGFVPNAETFAAYAGSWRLWRGKSGDYAPGTLANDKRNVAALSRSPLGGMRMDEITPEACREALLWVKSHPVKAGGELSGATMNKIHSTLGAIMRQAADDGRTARNPMARVKAPKVDTAERDALPPEGIALLLDRLDGLPLDGRVMALYLITCLGLRRGEACALMDADVSGGVARVRLAVKERDGSIAGPKSLAGTRTLPVPPRLQAKIGEWRAARREMGYGDAPTLACNTRGGVLRPQLLQRWWSGDSAHIGVRGRLGCDGMTLHQLRHSNLSMMARHLSPFDLQRYAGWSSIAPARVYVHDDFGAVSRAVSDAWSSIGRTKNAPVKAKGQRTSP